MFHAGIGSPLADRLIERIVAPRGAEGRAVALSESFYRRLVEMKFADRLQDQFALFTACQLGQGIEGANGVQLVAEEIQPQRLLLAGRIEIQNAAAQRVFARFLDCVDALVAVLAQEGRQGLDRDPIPGFGGDRATLGGVRSRS